MHTADGQTVTSKAMQRHALTHSRRHARGHTYTCNAMHLRVVPRAVVRLGHLRHAEAPPEAAADVGGVPGIELEVVEALGLVLVSLGIGDGVGGRS